MWYETCGWNVIYKSNKCYIWHVKYDIRNITCKTWHVSLKWEIFNGKCDTWNICEIWPVKWYMWNSIFQMWHVNKYMFSWRFYMRHVMWCLKLDTFHPFFNALKKFHCFTFQFSFSNLFTYSFNTPSQLL